MTDIVLIFVFFKLCFFYFSIKKNEWAEPEKQES